MAIFFGYKTAECILDSAEAREFSLSDETPSICGFVDDVALSSVDLTRFELPPGKPLDLVVGSREKRRVRNDFRCHMSSADLPHGAYLEIAPDVFVASPALCLLQRCGSLSFAGRIKLAARFCGCYAPSKTDPRGFITRAPLLSNDDLLSCIELYPSARSTRQALEAVQWALPNAESPMETEMVMPFYLPGYKGGFGLPKPIMNDPVTLTARGRAMTGKSEVRIDAHWPDANFGLEYQSKMFHDGDEHYGQDIGRQLALESMGKVIHMVTLEQLRNETQLEYIAELIASHLGIEMHKSRGGKLREKLIRDILSD